MVPTMDVVFKALADPTRRGLLDALFKQDGQTLSALERRLPMTRFGVMKHLRVLEEAGLVTTKRRGREKLHFLNPVPIRLVHDRWVSKYAEPWAASLSALKKGLEEEVMEKVFEIYIKTTPERLWKAITDREMRRKYNFGVGITSDWTPGSRYEAGSPMSPTLIFEGENLEVDPKRRLVQSFRALWGEDVKAEGTSRVTWEIEPVGDSCRLTVTHDQLRSGANDQLYGGWPMILSGLKTLLETGGLLTTPGSLRYSKPPESIALRTRITQVGTVGVPVSDQNRALEFYVGKLGFEKRMDVPYGEGERWVEVAPPGASTTIALVRTRKGDPIGIDTQVRVSTKDAGADHADLRARGVDADAEVMRYPVPMFVFRDPDGNRLYIVERD